MKLDRNILSVALILLLPLVLAASVDAESLQESSAVCLFSPAAYTPGQGVLVTIAVTPAASVNAQAVEDSPPVGWTVTGTSDAGAWDAVNGKVKWGPFFDSAARSLSYTATVPSGETGTKTFAGSASFDGASIPIAGARSIAPAGGSCTLTCTANAFPGSGAVPLAVNFTATATASNCAGNPSYAWAFGDGATSIQQNQSHTYTAAGMYSWTFTVSQEGQTCAKGGTITVTGGGASTAVCTFSPTAYTPGQGVLVTIAVTPAASVNAQAVEDSPPVGWTVTGTSDAGAWDAVNGKVKWGPFFDSSARSLTYTATPPPGETGAKTFAGAASFDGASIPITGARSMPPAPICTPTCTATASPTSGSAPLAVSFTATVTTQNCTGSPTWSWIFGDGGTSAGQNPSHTYATPGTKSWTLAVTVQGVTCSQSGSVVITCDSPSVTDVKSLADPFRLSVRANGLKNGYLVYIAGQSSPWTNIKVKSSSQFLIKGAKAYFPKNGSWVAIKIVNPSGCSVTFEYNRKTHSWRPA